MTTTPLVRALLFDIFGTVVDWRSGVAKYAAAFAEPRSLDSDWLELADAWRALYQPAMEEIRSGRREWVKLDVLHREMLEVIAPDFSLAGLPASDLDELNLAWHYLDPWADSVAGITRLKRDFIVAPCSNGNVSLMVDMAKHTGLPWDMILGSEVARGFKPQPIVYLASAEILSLPPEQCMLVAAHNADLEAARAVGLRTAFIRRPDEFGPKRRSDDPTGHDFDYVANDMIDLANQLGC